MRAAMLKRKAEILQRMGTSVERYPLELGLGDIVDYYYDGTFTRAFQNLVSESKRQEQEAGAAVSETIKR